MTKALKETLNEVRILGTLKEKNIEYYILPDGREAIRGNVRVEVKEGEKIHNHKVELFSMKLRADGGENGLFKGYETVMKEYEIGEKISITGKIEVNDFMTKTGDFVTNNRISGTFFNRQQEPLPDSAVADVEMVVTSRELEPLLDSEGLPKGDNKLSGYMVGYFNKKSDKNVIVPLEEIVVSDTLANQIRPYYVYGNTVRLTLALNNYSVVVKEEAPKQSMTFGETVDFDVAKEFVNEFRMTGGHMPYTDGQEYSDEEKVLIEKYRQAAIDDVKGIGGIPEFAEVDNSNIPFMDNDKNEIPDF